VKKGRHRRFEEARALKRSHEVDLHDLFDSISDAPDTGEYKPEHDAWADLAEEWDSKEDDSADSDESDSDSPNDDAVESKSDAGS
jgi:hypothetical protein